MTIRKDFSVQAIVLRWVKLKESDAILKMVAPDGRLLEAVAKSARKPKTATSARLEPLNLVEVYLAKGRGLHIVKDSRILASNASIRQDPCKYASTSCFCELLCKTLQPDIEVERVFDLTRTYLDIEGGCGPEKTLALTAAAILKASAYLGFMPSLEECVMCGRNAGHLQGVGFSYTEGGMICGDCLASGGGYPMEAGMIENARALLHMTLKDIRDNAVLSNVGPSMLSFANTWVKVQAQVNLKSVPLAQSLCA